MPIPPNITPGPANAFGLTFSIHQSTIQAALSVPLVPSPPAEYSYGKPEMHSKQNKNADSQPSISEQKEIQKLPEKDVFKVVTTEKIPSSSQVFNFCFVDEIKDPCINKTYKKSRPVMHTYNDDEKNLMLIHSPKIPRVSQDIGSYLAAIIQDDDNDNIRFYLQDIMQA